MKFKKCLFLLFVSISSMSFAIHWDGEDGPPCSQSNWCQDPGYNCQCWCSECQGYRQKKVGTDNPVYQAGKCYCNPRDVGNYPSSAQLHSRQQCNACDK